MAVYRAEMHDLLFERASTDDSPPRRDRHILFAPKASALLGNTIEIDSEARAFLYLGRNATIDRCRVPIVREGGRAANGCSVN